ncbi:MAG TPA: serine/threonine-protein kinase [Thermoanaerobaculia bacterium]|nr:serine/threonine-protein kinase [Thermoanaerobaculia bacterium]
MEDQDGPTLIDGKYQVLSKIKEGGMGAIYLVRHVLLDEIRVVKAMRANIEEDQDAKMRFAREARMATALRHPNIAAVLDFLEDKDQTFYIVMEYIEGPSLAELIAERGRLPLETVLEIAIQTLDALAYLHRRSIVHRDVSPENIMLTEDGDGRPVVKVIDLGVAKHTEAATNVTRTGMFVGKLQYASPEQLGVLKRGEMIDGRSDLYSLACVLYLVTTGESPFRAETAQGYFSQHLVRGPRPFAESDRAGRVPESLRAVIVKALAKSREARYLSADEFRDALSAERKALQPLLVDAGARGDTAAVNASVRARILARRQAAKASALLDMPTVHVDAPPSPAHPAPAPAPPAPLEVRSGGPHMRAAASVQAGARRPVRLALAAAAVVLAGALAVLVFSRARSDRAAAAASGTVILTATPWARVVSVVDEESHRAFPAGDVATPARLALPPGRYVLTLRGDIGTREAEVTAHAEVRTGEETRLHARLPGFDLENAVRTYVP